jgi:hypothetical protein
VPAGPLTSGELRLLSIDVPEGQRLKVKKPYEVSIHFEAEGDIAYNSIDDNHGTLSGNPEWHSWFVLHSILRWFVFYPDILF